MVDHSGATKTSRSHENPSYPNKTASYTGYCVPFTLNTRPLYIAVLFFSNSEVVGHFLPVMLNLPSSCHAAVRHSSIKLVGELAEWIEKHPQYLGKYIVSLEQTMLT